jgi:hypothetical protein
MAVIAYRKGSSLRNCRTLHPLICCREQERRIEEFDNKVLNFPAYCVKSMLSFSNLPYYVSLVPEADNNNFILMTNYIDCVALLRLLSGTN